MTWSQTRLKFLFASVQNGMWGEEPKGDGTDFHCIRGTDFDRTAFKVSIAKSPMRSGDTKSLAQNLLRHGDLVLEKSGGSADHPVGSVALFDLHVRAVCSNFNARLRLSAGNDPRYITYLLNSMYSDGVTRQFVKQTTGIQNLDAGALLSESCSVPVLDEQRRIADFLDAETARIDELVSTQSSLIGTLQKRRQNVAFTEVTGRSAREIHESGLAWADRLPSSWDSVKLSFVARMGSGHTPSRARPEWWTDCTIPWITTGEVSQVRDDRREVIDETREKISLLGMANSSAELHPKHTVVLCRTASAGYSGVMGQPMATSQDFVTWTCTNRLDPFYLLWCLRAMRTDLLGRLAMGSTHKTIYVPDLQMLKIPLPPIAEQHAIVERIRHANARIDDLTDVVNSQLSLLDKRRQTLITAAVTGQFDVATARGADLS